MFNFKGLEEGVEEQARALEAIHQRDQLQYELDRLRSALLEMAEHHELVVEESQVREYSGPPSDRDKLFAAKCRELLGSTKK